MAAPIAEKLQFLLYDIEFVKEGGRRFLRVFLDKDGGITIDECETFSRLLSEQLDKSDPIPENYYLEVSSPGIERKIRRREHFEMNKGKPVDIGLYEAIGGSKKLTGILRGLDSEDNVIVDIGGERLSVPHKKTTVINVHFDF